MKSIIKLLLPFFLLQSAALWAQSDEPLRPEVAFPASIKTVDGQNISIHWKIADEYYLYRSKFKFRSDKPGIKLGTHVSPPGKIIDDEFFGRVETYRKGVTIQLPYSRTDNSIREFTLTVTSQGCADLGICYPPHSQKLTVKLPAASDAATSKISPEASSAPISALTQISRSLGVPQAGDGELLPPDQAFQLLIDTDDNGNHSAVWAIADGYYLYQDKITLSLVNPPAGVTLGALKLPAAKIKQDEFFGKVAVYYGGIDLPIPTINKTGTTQKVTIKVGYQGCADAGVCYQPLYKTFDLTVMPGSPAMPKTASTMTTTAASSPASANMPITMPADEPMAEQDHLAQLLVEQPLWLALIIFYVAGLGLAFTPCVFPMVPILSGIIVGQGEKITTGRAFSLSVAYVLAMALTYTSVGVIAALLGANLQVIFQNPWVLGVFAAVFVALAFSMFGFYELQMPSAVQSRLTSISNSQKSGSLISAAIMGFLSALIVGPCVSAPLIGALIVIGQTGDAVLGGSALFAISMGMGTPLLMIGASAGKLLPKAGPWMDTVKAVFGVGLLAIALWLIERVIPGPVGLFLWAMLFIVVAIYMGALETLQAGASGWKRLWKGLGIVLLIWGVLMVIGSSTGSRDMLNPLKKLVGSGAVVVAANGNTAGATTQGRLNFTRIKTVADLQREIASANANGQAVMLDFYADWCIYCVQMVERTFPDARVQAALAGVHLLKADVTANDAEDKALLNHFNIIAPPAILFFGTDGQEKKNFRVVGFQDAEKFTRHIRKALQ